MRPLTVFLALVVVAVMGCDRRERVSSNYVLVTPENLNPDSHPGTALHHKGKVVWANVHTGYFSGAETKQFSHDGMFVFVGAVPGPNDWWYHSQLFAVRGAGPPVMLSEHLLGEKFVMSYDSNVPGSRYAVDTITPVVDGVQVLFTHTPGMVNENTNSITLSWTRVRQLLAASDTSSRLVKHELGNYRILPP